MAVQRLEPAAVTERAQSAVQDPEGSVGEKVGVLLGASRPIFLE